MSKTKETKVLRDSKFLSKGALGDSCPPSTPPTYIIVQYDDRIIHQNCKYMMSINRLYCKIHNYKYIFIDDKDLYYHLPPYWIKVQLVFDILQKYPECKGVLWLDTDACVFDLDRSLDTFSGNFVCSSESPFWDGMNAGVWLVKNTSNGLAIMSLWLSFYNGEYWEKSDSQWICKVGEWAGISYEQGVFNINILKQYKDIYEINHVKWYMLNNRLTYDQEEKSFSYHFTGSTYKKAKRFDPFIKNILKVNSKYTKRIKRRKEKYLK